MTKKDYIAIANTIIEIDKIIENLNDMRECSKIMKICRWEVRDMFLRRFIKLFQADNPLFDKNRFIDYLNGDKRFKSDTRLATILKKETLIAKEMMNIK